MNLKELKKKGRLLKPIINIGKKGVTDELIIEIKKALKNKKLIKIKLNKSALEEKDKNDILDEIIKKTDAYIISFVGFNAVLHKK
ncbi:RNA-binding protein [Candidatus Woesearchaeota archaeon]|nr:RNA-binding protein [Candidatus Woesearchaeota archaeon]